ncbi:MAG: hypothetical protein LBC71_00865, partial [Oscillospiraceae bacterium]|nr:hypothetical protein [Oscillospiraceae bacterium]
MKNLAKILVLLVIVALAACDTNTQNSDTPNTDPPTDVIEIGTGNTTFQFEAVDNNEETTIWFVSTNE